MHLNQIIHPKRLPPVLRDYTGHDIALNDRVHLVKNRPLPQRLVAPEKAVSTLPDNFLNSLTIAC
jgi:hypothetical protein